MSRGHYNRAEGQNLRWYNALITMNARKDFAMTLELDTRQYIQSLLDNLPAESLPVVEQFVRFLQEQDRHGQTITAPPHPHYPTVALPAHSLENWLNLLPEGYEGDALADSEALYDEA
jgi:hypothetical protein